MTNGPRVGGRNARSIMQAYQRSRVEWERVGGLLTKGDLAGALRASLATLAAMAELVQQLADDDVLRMVRRRT